MVTMKGQGTESDAEQPTASRAQDRQMTPREMSATLSCLAALCLHLSGRLELEESELAWRTAVVQRALAGVRPAKLIRPGTVR